MDFGPLVNYVKNKIQKKNTSIKLEWIIKLQKSLNFVVNACVYKPLLASGF